MKHQHLFLEILLVVFAVGCGGGGGGGSAGSTSSLGSVSGYLDRGAVARIASREAALQPVSGATVTIYAAGITVITATDQSGRFNASGIPPGNYAEATAVFSGKTMKAFYDAPAGGSTSKNINARSTAAAMVYLQLKGRGKATPSSISYIEQSALIDDIKTEIENALQSDTYDYSAQFASASVEAVISRLDSGGSFSDAQSPAITVQTPQSGALVSDVDFRAETFSVVFKYSDAYAVYFQSLTATLKMDSGEARDISAYFVQTDSTTISSAGIYQFNRTLFDLPSNDVSRTITITVSAQDVSGNTSSGTTQFTVYPVSPPSSRKAR